MLVLSSLAKKVFGTANDRRLKEYQPRVQRINALEAEIKSLSDAELSAKTQEFKELLDQGKTLDDLLEPAFATVREAAWRTLGQRHFDVQLIGGMVLHEGAISEMKTGEGKTLVATLAVYLNALAGEGVHVVTVNDYLAKRDAAWMGQIYEFLGLSVGVVVHDIDQDARKAAYGADVTYGTNNEFGFDYLRDNMELRKEQMVQRGHQFAIVDEVDSILIDEARTPLIISGPVEDQSDLYRKVDKLIPLLNEEDYEIDEKVKSANFTDSGTEKIEQLLIEHDLLVGTLYDVENVTIVHHINQALRAHKLFQRDKDYIVKNGQVVIIDEFTGRMMEGRRYSDGLHQALEAREGVDINPENQTYASVTYQNYFRLYKKLAGMTGTAATEAEEFGDIYKLEVVEIPTNVDVARIDYDDEIYRTSDEKYGAILELIKECRERGQPVLVGTTSIEKSEYLAEKLRANGLKEFQVLNARYHEQEAQIIAQAGVPGAVTIATNMAGRGTDIQLGGNLEMRLSNELSDQAGENERMAISAQVGKLKAQALAAGGLFVIGTERHESRRIDNQLRGRSGRQGDPGASKFFLALEDDLMRIFGTSKMDMMLKKLNADGEAIVHPWINKAIERAQTKVEGHHFDARKQVLKFDDVMNDQRKVVFEQRLDLMSSDHVTDTVVEMREDVVHALVEQHIPENAYPEQWTSQELQDEITTVFGLSLPVCDWAKEEGIAEDEIINRISRAAREAAAAKTARFTPDLMHDVERMVLLQTLDTLWREHLVTLEHLRQVVNLRGYGQRDPLNEYKSESFTLFENMLINLRRAVTMQMMHIELGPNAPSPEEHDNRVDGSIAEATHRQKTRRRQMADARDPENPATWGKVGRNEACPCGSGKKYKQCHGKLNQ